MVETHCMHVKPTENSFSSKSSWPCLVFYSLAWHTRLILIWECINFRCIFTLSMPSPIIQTLPTSGVRKNEWYLELYTDLKKHKLIIAISCWTRLGISIWSSLSLDCFSIWLQHNDRWTFLNSNNYWKVDRCDNSQLRGRRVFY